MDEKDVQLNEVEGSGQIEETEEASNTSADASTLWIWTFLAHWELVVMIVGTPMNAFVIFIWATLSSHSSNRRYSGHSKNRWFILSMTCGDFIFVLLHSPLSYMWYGSVIDMTAWPCYIMYGATHFSTTISSISLLLLNVDKFIYLHWPLHYRSMMTTKRAIGLTVGTWLVSFTWMIIFLFGPFLQRLPDCYWKPQHHEFYLIFLIVFFLMPILLSTATSLYIATVAIKTSISEAKAQAEFQPSVHTDFLSDSAMGDDTTLQVPHGDGRHSVSPSKNTGRHSSAAAMLAVKPWRTITFVFSTTIWSSITYLPYRIGVVVFTMTRHTDISWYLPMLALMVVYPAGNPFITIFTQPSYRRRALDIFLNIKSCLRRICVNGTSNKP